MKIPEHEEPKTNAHTKYDEEPILEGKSKYSEEDEEVDEELEE